MVSLDHPSLFSGNEHFWGGLSWNLEAKTFNMRLLEAFKLSRFQAFKPSSFVSWSKKELSCNHIHYFRLMTL